MPDAGGARVAEARQAAPGADAPVLRAPWRRRRTASGHPAVRVHAAGEHARERRVATGVRRRCARAAAAAAARRRWPSASISARRTTSCTSDCSRKRTSAFVGCTLTSTASGGISMNRCTSGLRSLIDADAVGVDDRVRDRPVLDDAAVDEDVLRAARRPLLRQRRDEAGQRGCRRPPCALRSGRPRSPYS